MWPRQSSFDIKDPEFLRRRLTSSLRIVEEEFGARWLHQQMSRPPDQRSNWVPSAYQESIALLGSLTSAQMMCRHVFDVILLADNLAAVRSVPGYALAIQSGDLRGSGVSAFEYNIYVANLAGREGHRAAFIPSLQGVETPDLVVHLHAPTLVECKSKESFDAPPGDPIHRRLDRLREVIEAIPLQGFSCDILIAMVTNAEPTAESIAINWVSRAIRSNTFGHEVDSAAGVFAAVLPPEPPPFDAPPGVGLNLAHGIGSAAGTVEVCECGGARLAVQRTVRVHSFSAPRIRSLTRTVGKAAGKLPSSDSGLIFVDVDVASTPAWHIEAYLDLAAAAVTRVFRRSGHSRVGAVVLTGPPMVAMAQRHGVIDTARFRAIRWIQNPNGNWPADVRFPAKHTEPMAA